MHFRKRLTVLVLACTMFVLFTVLQFVKLPSASPPTRSGTRLGHGSDDKETNDFKREVAMIEVSNILRPLKRPQLASGEGEWHWHNHNGNYTIEHERTLKRHCSKTFAQVLLKTCGFNKEYTHVLLGLFRTLTSRVQVRRKGSVKPWEIFGREITKDYLYTEEASYMANLLHTLGTVDIAKSDMFTGGSQVKLDFTLADGNRAIVKPMRVSRDFVYDIKEYFWLDQERHNAEIASFHLDRVLNFRRVPPCAGRLINMTKEILKKSHDEELLKTFIKKDGNVCFIGKCAPWFCNDEHPICGKGEMIEVSLCQYLPLYKGNSIPVFEKEYPWSQGVKERKVWNAKNVCQDLLIDKEFTEGRMLLDLIEQGIFDFLIRNYDRHHYDMLRQFGKFSFVAFLDNGKGFGNPKPEADDITFLAPVYQCCKIRNSTYERFKLLARKESLLSDLLRQSLSYDLLSPIITEDHLKSMDRRLLIVIETIDKCIRKNGQESVLVDHL